MNLADLIFVSLEDWDQIWRRNQFVCAELARRHPDMKILFVGLPRNLSNDLRKGNLRSVTKPAVWNVPGIENITVTHPWKLFPDTLTAGRKANEMLYRRQVRRVAKKLGIRQPLLWLNSHSAVHMVGRMGERGVVYDVTDDWITLTQRPRLAELTRRQDAELCRKADVVVVCSRRLRRMKRKLAREVYLIPNGVDAEHYRMVLDGTGPLPEITQPWKHPVLGYTGTIHPDRVDVGLLEAVASALPDASIALVGPNFLSEEDQSRLRACGNVFLTGSVPYTQVPSIMRAFDVCITPHRMSEFTESLNPIKLWEYLAAGRPVVSTDVAGFRDYPNLVRLARTADEFVQRIGQALGENGAVAQARREEAQRHSWRSRVDQIEQVLERAFSISEKRPKSQHLVGQAMPAPSFAMTSTPGPASASSAADCAAAGDASALPAVSAIVVSYNTRAMTLECLRELSAGLEGIAAEVLVADNGSTDGSAGAIREEFPDARVLANDRNLGFGAANNQLMALARGDYLLLLNSDAFVAPGTVWTLVDYLEQHPRVAAVGARLLNADSSVQNSCFPFPSPLRAWLENLWVPKLLPHGGRWGDYRGWQHDREKRVDWVVGACMLVRRAVYRQVGGFDERFFMYAEETDWERRMRDAGWEIAFNPAAQVKHLGGASGKTEKPRINEQFFASLDLYELKHHGVFGLVLLRIAMVIGAFLRIPMWAAVWLLMPGWREAAGARLKMLCWLLGRQALYWKVLVA